MFIILYFTEKSGFGYGRGPTSAGISSVAVTQGLGGIWAAKRTWRERQPRQLRQHRAAEAVAEFQAFLRKMTTRRGPIYINRLPLLGSGFCRPGASGELVSTS